MRYSQYIWAVTCIPVAQKLKSTSSLSTYEGMV